MDGMRVVVGEALSPISNQLAIDSNTGWNLFIHTALRDGVLIVCGGSPGCGCGGVGSLRCGCDGVGGEEKEKGRGGVEVVAFSLVVSLSAMSNRCDFFLVIVFLFFERAPCLLIFKPGQG